MQTTDNPVFIDMNILVYANLALSPFHLQATERLQAIEEQGIELWISRQTLREYLAAMTRKGDLTGEIPVSSLVEDVRYFSNRFRLAEDNLHVTERLLTLMEEITIGGKQVHDANIVATMLVYGIPQLLTHNTGDFARFSELITVLPLQE
ncbi:VapC toxin family PIN domain ribonuclease [Brasilonema octagenarum UFV-E1]|uniref:VapC toxin family PIN domain ribonuclease n=2 Tax=Brasilonema TaxID=383614 RepID=A0A856MI07_9CYAN|nr:MULTISPECIES: type II toxin-antitoxin system VapC family toxin [Brasilonema]NMF62154.1 VapC toxin family PIN domain ribonuclease [Brasilonema octagenarum UFV-OR1]QDL08767.1 VapC toxin family PIN domain ribonuclease [Brasilonema sennae CENA114]QDL15125.1 VapC toxin family PIN domain ribonuclease [Brasilonema octagenarum UFV-E1]